MARLIVEETLSVLEANLGWMRFYSLRDRDYLTDAMVQEYRHHTSGRIYVWSRNQIENYLLEDEAISRVLRDYTAELRHRTALGKAS